jgi:hypothetical protein
MKWALILLIFSTVAGATASMQIMCPVNMMKQVSDDDFLVRVEDYYEGDVPYTYNYLNYAGTNDYFIGPGRGFDVKFFGNLSKWHDQSMLKRYLNIKLINKKEFNEYSKEESLPNLVTTIRRVRFKHFKSDPRVTLPSEFNELYQQHMESGIKLIRNFSLRSASTSTMRRFYDLPLQGHISKNLNQKLLEKINTHYPYLIEIGRAYRLKKDLPIAVLIMARKAQVRGLEISRIGFLGHATTEQNFNHFQSMYKFNKIGQEGSGSHFHGIVFQSLDKLLEKYHPSDYFPMLGSLKKYSSEKALKIWAASVRYFNHKHYYFSAKNNSVFSRYFAKDAFTLYDRSFISEAKRYAILDEMRKLQNGEPVSFSGSERISNSHANAALVDKAKSIEMLNYVNDERKLGYLEIQTLLPQMPKEDASTFFRFILKNRIIEAIHHKVNDGDKFHDLNIFFAVEKKISSHYQAMGFSPVSLLGSTMDMHLVSPYNGKDIVIFRTTPGEIGRIFTRTITDINLNEFILSDNHFFHENEYSGY